MELIESLKAPNGPLLVCKDHSEKDIEFYCSEHNTFHCTLCVWGHSDHRDSVRICTRKDIKVYNEHLLGHLGSLKARIEEKEYFLGQI
jgi:hypothetical protein